MLDYDLIYDDLNERSPRSTAFARYEEFLSRELPRRVCEMLEVAMNNELQPIEDKLKSQLVEMVRTCQEDLFRAYQQSLDPVSSTNSDANGHGTAGSNVAFSEPDPTNHSEPLVCTEVEENLAPFVSPPHLGLDTWPAFDGRGSLSGQLINNSESSDSGYNSLESLFQECINDRSQNTRGDQEWWNMINSNATDRFPSTSFEYPVFPTLNNEYIHTIDDQITPSIGGYTKKGKGRAGSTVDLGLPGQPEK